MKKYNYAINIKCGLRTPWRIATSGTFTTAGAENLPQHFLFEASTTLPLFLQRSFSWWSVVPPPKKTHCNSSDWASDSSDWASADLLCGQCPTSSHQWVTGLACIPSFSNILRNSQTSSCTALSNCFLFQPAQLRSVYQHGAWQIEPLPEPVPKPHRFGL